ncbi:MAG: M23 family metallopeptidase [Myxococcota bacterium]
MAAVLLILLAGAERLYLEEEPPPVAQWPLAGMIVTAPLWVEDGGLLVLDATLSRQCQHLSWLWQDKRWPTHRVRNTRRVMMPVLLDTPPGRHPVVIDCDGVRQSIQVAIARQVPRVSRIKHRFRPGQVFERKRRRFGEPPLDRIRREGRALADAFSKATRERLWSGRFLRPASGVDTSAFGSVRIVRGQRSLHEGLDIAGGDTDAVYAANEGRVLLVSDDYFFVGNSVVLDHGEGLLTLYLHLDTPLVREGQRVRRGEPLGTIGNTGRVTGPHLHFAVRFRGRYIDPNDLLRYVPDAPLPDALSGPLLTPDLVVSKL